eukprot:m.70 g.70  ORF g.70 m.70 type:complete len:550 (-) comp49_c0_seq1:80-1729(-)
MSSNFTMFLSTILLSVMCTLLFNRQPANAQYPLGCDTQLCGAWCADQGKSTFTEVQNVGQLMCCCGFATRNKDDIYECQSTVFCPSQLTHYLLPPTTTTTTTTTPSTTTSTTITTTMETTKAASPTSTITTTETTSSTTTATTATTACNAMQNNNQYDSSNLILFRHNSEPSISFPIHYRGSLTAQTLCFGHEYDLWYSSSIPYCSAGNSQVDIKLSPSFTTPTSEIVVTLAVFTANNENVFPTTSLLQDTDISNNNVDDASVFLTNSISLNSASFFVGNAIPQIWFNVGLESQSQLPNSEASFNITVSIICKASGVDDQVDDSNIGTGYNVSTKTHVWVWPVLAAALLLLVVSFTIVIWQARISTPKDAESKEGASLSDSLLFEEQGRQNVTLETGTLDDNESVFPFVPSALDTLTTYSSFIGDSEHSQLKTERSQESYNNDEYPVVFSPNSSLSTTTSSQTKRRHVFHTSTSHEDDEDGVVIIDHISCSNNSSYVSDKGSHSSRSYYDQAAIHSFVGEMEDGSEDGETNDVAGFQRSASRLSRCSNV